MIYELEPEDRRAIIQARMRIIGAPAFVKFWDYVLTEQERKTLGDDIDRCYNADLLPVNHLGPLRDWSPERSIVEIAYRLNHLSTVEYRRLVTNVLGGSVGSSQPVENEPQRNHVPKWDAQSGKLTYGGKVCRSIKVLRATSIVPVLNAFETAGWPDHLSVTVDTSKDPQHIHQVVRNLNHDLSLLKFFVQGDCISWASTAS